MIARVIGRVTVIFVPMPCSLWTSITPPSLLMFVLTTSIPTPRPEISLSSPLVETPGMKIRLRISARLIARASSAEMTPRRTLASRRRVVSMPPPSSSISMTTWLPFWKALSAIVPSAGLPTASRSLRVSIP